MSSYLFSFDMEYLSRCLISLENDYEFICHLRCKRVKLTHVMLVDNLLLLLFYKTDKGSIKEIMRQFKKFSLSSVLEANTKKCEVYSSGVSDSFQDEMCKELNMVKETLHFRYLGIPLASRKLNFA